MQFKRASDLLERLSVPGHSVVAGDLLPTIDGQKNLVSGTIKCSFVASIERGVGKSS